MSLILLSHEDKLDCYGTFLEIYLQKKVGKSNLVLFNSIVWKCCPWYGNILEIKLRYCGRGSVFSVCTLFYFQGVPSNATLSTWSGEGLYSSEHDHRNETRVDREHLTNLLSGQLEVHLESLRRLRATGVTHQESEHDKQTSVDTDRPNEGTNTSCSTSFLFGQLRYVPRTSKTLFTLALPTPLSNVMSEPRLKLRYQKWWLQLQMSCF